MNTFSFANKYQSLAYTDKANFHEDLQLKKGLTWRPIFY
ncbi:protein of unknown function [Shewanella benthica]|uniref:Uncharacterized protein n=1 Tax=Shewanella benthica TaxID=43661 RepID=A0A330M147_9GAMM|nr:protein of unknown function [Shewanella benthica]